MVLIELSIQETVCGRTPQVSELVELHLIYYSWLPEIKKNSSRTNEELQMLENVP